MSFAAILSTEILKLKRSRTLIIAVAAPVLLVAAVYGMLLGFNRGRGALPFELLEMFALQLWAFFMLPLSITALSLVTAQVEHSAKAWNYALTLPVARWRLFAVKAGIILFLALMMSAAVYLLLPLAGWLREVSAGGMSGEYGWREVPEKLARVLAGAILLIAIQLWAALRFRGFAIPLGVGIGGGFIGVVAMIGANIVKNTDGPFRFFPWLIPVETLQSNPVLAQTVWFGLFGGIVALVAMIAHLSWREVA